MAVDYRHKFIHTHGNCSRSELNQCDGDMAGKGLTWWARVLEWEHISLTEDLAQVNTDRTTNLLASNMALVCPTASFSNMD